MAYTYVCVSTYRLYINTSASICELKSFEVLHTAQISSQQLRMHIIMVLDLMLPITSKIIFQM